MFICRLELSSFDLSFAAPMAALLDRIRARLRHLAEQVEDIHIETETLRKMLISEHNVLPERIDKAVEQAKLDPLTRKRMHQNFSAMWAALDDHARDALLEDLLERHEPHGRPN
jgi:hypothetical protein